MTIEYRNRLYARPISQKDAEAEDNDKCGKAYVKSE
jgi:hypothetical protein